MIILAGSAGHAANLGRYLMAQGENERVELRDIRGVDADTPLEALLDMAETAHLATDCQKPLYHAVINPEPGEEMTPERWDRAAALLEERLGLDDHARVVVMHTKEGREHMHVVWSRLDEDEGRLVRMSHDYAKGEAVARQLEEEFGHGRVPGPHSREADEPRPERAPDRDAMEQGKRSGIDPRALKERVTELWEQSDCGRAFVAAMDQEGFVVAAGDRRDFVIVDPEGGVHGLRRSISGGREAAIREKMADVDRDSLPGVTEAQALQEMRSAAVEQGIMRAPPELPRSAYEEHQERAARAVEGLHGDGDRLAELQAENAVVFGRDEAGRIHACTERYGFQLSDMELLRFQSVPDEADAMPTLKEAKRAAYGLAQRNAMAETIRAGIGETRETDDGGAAFAARIEASDLRLRQDEGGRFYVADAYRRHIELESVAPDSAALLSGLADVEQFRSRADRQEAYDRDAARAAHMVERLEAAEHIGELYADGQSAGLAFGQRDGAVYIVTAKHEFALEADQGRKFLDLITAAHRALDEPGFMAGELPSIEDARRAVFRESHEERFADAARAAYEHSREAGDGGIAFASEVFRAGYTLERDYGDRLYVCDGRRRMNVAEIAPDWTETLAALQEERVWLGFEKFASAEDRAGVWEQRRADHEQRQAESTLHRIIHAPDHGIARAADATETLMSGVTGAVADIGESAARLFTRYMAGLADFFTGGGTPQHEAPPPPPRAERPEPSVSDQARHELHNMPDHYAAMERDLFRDAGDPDLTRRAQDIARRQAEARERDRDLERER